MMENLDLPCSPIIITLPQLYVGEADAIIAIQAVGVGIIHIRKPDATESQIEAFLSELTVKKCDMSRLTLHYNESIARKYSLGGVHFTSTQFEREILSASASIDSTQKESMRISCSTHSWEEAERFATIADYVFLSPIFDSISKCGYKSSFDLDEISRNIISSKLKNIVALGGVDCRSMVSVARAEFGGVALIGAAWSDDGKSIDIKTTVQQVCQLQRAWKVAQYGSLQFISNGDMAAAEAFLNGGGRWVQLRMKDTPTSEILARGREMLTLCHEHNAILIVNDDPKIAMEIGADGIHIGQGDISVFEARKLVGQNSIIGSTANSLEQIEALHNGPTDYIGLGPFRYTSTKKNLAPIIGLEGYNKILSAMALNDLHLPVVAIGGIEISDCKDIMQTGVFGLALSGAIAKAENITAVTIKFKNNISCKH